METSQMDIKELDSGSKFVSDKGVILLSQLNPENFKYCLEYSLAHKSTVEINEKAKIVKPDYSDLLKAGFYMGLIGIVELLVHDGVLSVQDAVTIANKIFNGEIDNVLKIPIHLTESRAFPFLIESINTKRFVDDEINKEEIVNSLNSLV
jgi:hypothetical protein